jgi:hypothetical protein
MSGRVESRTKGTEEEWNLVQSRTERNKYLRKRVNERTRARAEGRRRGSAVYCLRGLKMSLHSIEAGKMTCIEQDQRSVTKIDT